MSSTKVFSLDIFESTVNGVNQLVNESDSISKEVLSQCQRVLEEAQIEEQNSRLMLEEARVEEAMRLAEVISLTAGLPETAYELYQAEQEYERAKVRRERLERRYELAQKCLEIATENLEETTSIFNITLNDINEKKNSGLFRINRAYEDLKNYLSTLNSTSLKKVEEYIKYSYKEKNPVKPDEILKRLNLSSVEMFAILYEKYAKDEKFFNLINNYREEAKTISKEEIITKLKKNLAGSLGEEIVIRAFVPYGKNVLTQERTVTEDGKYTKTDLILKDLKVPIILGKGEGMGAREGSDLAIEVKTGKSTYLYAQKEHMQFQSLGHLDSKLSCTICSKDIKNLGSEKEEELRKVMKNSGSPLFGMLPYKEDLDKVCIDFVFGEDKNV
ncbi:hypothetical protein KST14_01040 [Fusobacterium animalis]|jgi:hypothetical protein|uniref:hypothetical protein n=1 Tax=Fusobacterium animalis TaxID=76859 RepID=UPI0030D04D76